MANEGFIKIYRQILQWEWYTDTNAKIIFLHCLLKANYKPGRWRGIPYEAGEFFTSLASLSRETRLSTKKVRTALQHLQNTGELADVTAERTAKLKSPRGRILKVCNWELYQTEGKEGAKQGQSKGKVRATDKERKEYKEIKEQKEYGTAALPDAPEAEPSSFIYAIDGEPDAVDVSLFLADNCPHVFASEFIQYCRGNNWKGECEDWKALAIRWETYRAKPKKRGIND